MILSSQTIRNRVNDPNDLTIEPFFEAAKFNGRSFGLSCCGYDVRLAQNLIVWPFWGRLGSIIEYLSLPDDLCAEVKDKSTNARLFILVQNTIIEPGWKGYLTLEITRFKPWPIFLRKGTPIAQLVFKKLDCPTEHPYSGKYQNQNSDPQRAILPPSSNGRRADFESVNRGSNP